jgi:hypothetical protein
MKILIVEDDLNKLHQLQQCLSAEYPQADIIQARSYQSGLKTALAVLPSFIVLDMTLPTYDVSTNESGGRPRPFAGREILNEVARKLGHGKVIVVTQFETFGEGPQKKTLPELDTELRKAFPDLYIGAVYYHPAQSDWKTSLRKLAHLAETGVGR